MTTDYGTEQQRIQAPPASLTNVRRALWVVLAGSVIFWIGLPFPVVTDYFESANGAERIAVIDGDRTQFAVAFGLLGAGAAVAGIGLWLLGRAIAPMEAERSRRRGLAAQTAGWLGLLGVLAGASRLLHAVFATPEYMEGDNYIDPAVGVIGAIGTSLALITVGVLAWSAPPPKWTAVVLVLGGVAAAVTFLPLFWYFALIVFAIANLIVMRRLVASPEATAATPAT